MTLALSPVDVRIDTADEAALDIADLQPVVTKRRAFSPTLQLSDKVGEQAGVVAENVCLDQSRLAPSADVDDDARVDHAFRPGFRR